MDLSTVKDKLKNRLYASPLDFRDDVNLIWDNCACYNQEGTPARTDGEAMRGIWKRAWQESRAPGDIIVFAIGTDADVPKLQSWDDSEAAIRAYATREQLL